MIFGLVVGLEFCLKERYNIEMSRDGLRLFLKRAGFTYQKPEKRYYEGERKAQKLWLKKVLPKIKRVSKKKGAILYFLDESSVCLSDFRGRTWSKKGKTPVIEVTGKKGNLACISSISNRGYLLFKVKRGRITGEDVIKFLTDMLKHHKRRKLVVVLDNASVHTSKKVKNFIKKQKRLKVFDLPKRSPHLSADEQVWNHLKNYELKGHKERGLDGFEKLVNKKLSTLSKNKSKIRGIVKMSEISSYLN